MMKSWTRIVNEIDEIMDEAQKVAIYMLKDRSFLYARKALDIYGMALEIRKTILKKDSNLLMLKHIEKEENEMTETVPFTEKDVKHYLDACIRVWRTKRKNGDRIAVNYIDAYQSVRISLFGSMLPIEKENKNVANI